MVFISWIILGLLLIPDCAHAGKDIMIEIMAGKFVMGSKSGYNNSRPRHAVYLDKFLIDKFEVTVRDFKIYADTVKSNNEIYFNKKGFNDPDFPVGGISWYVARDYCKSIKKRLPTEAEWEKASSWDDKNKKKYYFAGKKDWFYYNLVNNWFDGPKGPSMVGSYPEGNSPYGLSDVIGNVWEWVEDWFMPDYYKESPEKKPKGPLKGEKKVIRGGSWGNIEDVMSTAFRGADYPDRAYSVYGFRCAK